VSLAVLGAAVATAPAGAARADGIGVVVAAGAPAELAARVADAIAARGDGRRIEPAALALARAALADGAVPRATLVRFRQVREQVEDAWQAYLQVQVEFAASRLATARTAAEELLALPGGAELYADAGLRLGAVLLQLGRRAEAAPVLALARALDPARPISTREFAPDVLEAIEAGQANPPLRRAVRVVVTPAGAAVAIDGHPVGVAPIALELPRGQHVVVARASGFRPAAQAVAVDDATSTLELSLEPDELAAAVAAPPPAGLGARASAAVVDAALRFGELDEIVLAAVADRRGAPALLVQRCAAGDAAARCTAVIEIGFAETAGLAAAARAGWAEVATAPLREPPGLLADPRLIAGGHGDGRCAVCRSPWLWGGVATGVVLGAAAIWLATSGSRPPPIVGGDPGGFIGR
jgi:hypothetical protein